MLASIQLQPIGTVRSPITTPVDSDWGAVLSEIHLTEELVEGLKGIEQFSHLVVIFLMHLSDFDQLNDLVRRPRGRADMPEVGIFAQRARHRPNPIGVTAVRLVRMEGSSLLVVGLDAIDGTPVLDIKPYVQAFDKIEDVRVPDWVEKLMQGYF